MVGLIVPCIPNIQYSSFDIPTNGSDLKQSIWLPIPRLFAILIVFHHTVSTTFEQILVRLRIVLPGPFFDSRFVGCAGGGIIEGAQAAYP